MSLEQRLSSIFPQSFQINRVLKEVEALKDAKPKLGLEIRYISRQNTQFVMVIEISKQKIKEFKRLAFLDKLEFKVVLKNSYPTEQPSLYFLNENAIELGINPFHNYLKNICPEWGPKISVLDIVRLVPSFMIQIHEKTKQIIGEPVLREYFQVERLFTFQGCHIFPVKLFRSSTSFTGIIGLIKDEEIVLMEQSNFANSYLITDFLKVQEVYSVQKHKSNYLRSLLEVKRQGKKYAIQFSSDEFETIIASIIEKMKVLSVFEKENSESSESDDEVEIQPQPKSKQNHEFAITDANIQEVESQMLILQSLIESKPVASNIKELVDLLKKAVEYYSIQGDERCQVHLKALQNIMNNEFLQVLLTSEGDQAANSYNRGQYESIANFI